MEAVRVCAERGVEVLSLFAFSTENWERPEEEVRFLVNMSREVLRKRMEEFMRLGVRLRHIGSRERIPPEILAWFDMAYEVTRSNRGLNLNINFNYGGRGEILDAARGLAAEVRAGRMNAADIDEAAVSRHLYAPELPDIDLLIRTAGEMRISNFMLWRLARSRMVVTPVLWPDFGRAELEGILAAYQAERGRESDYDPC